VLEERRADPCCVAPSRVQLWPEHLDAAFDCGPAQARTTLGASPGDREVPEPYLYRLHDGALAVRALSAVVGAPDQRAAALAFLRAER
jgi:hypothetical protein